MGFIGGRDADEVTYRQVCNGDTGHAEAVKILYDPKVVPYAELVGMLMFCVWGGVC